MDAPLRLALFAAIIGLGLGASCDTPSFKYLTKRKLTYGDTYNPESGVNIRSYLELNSSSGEPLAAGVELDRAIIANISMLPTCGLLVDARSIPVPIPCPPETPDFIMLLDFPTASKNATPFPALQMHWLSGGDVPQFNMLFMSQPKSEILSQLATPGPCGVGTSPSIFFNGNKPMPTQCYPRGVDNTGVVVPLAGNYYSNPDQVTVDEQPMLPNFVWGGYNGKVSFFDVVASLALLKKSVGSKCFPIPGYPDEFAIAGYKPRCYCVILTPTSVFVELRNFQWYDSKCDPQTPYLSGWVLPSVNPSPTPKCPVPKPDTPTPTPTPTGTRSSGSGSTDTGSSGDSSMDPWSPLDYNASIGGNYTSPLCRQLIKTSSQALNDVLWPKSAEIALSHVYPLFTPNITGRVVPVGTFSDVAGAIEYFYVLAGPLSTNPLDGVGQMHVSGVDIKFIDCDDSSGVPRTSYLVEFQFNNGTTEADNVVRLQVSGFYVFNNEGKICSYDWTIRRLGFAQDNQVVPDTFPTREAAYAGVCTGIQTYCTGNNTQYSSLEECVSFMGTLPWGSWDYADQNNFVCRTLHTILVPSRPAVHCPHTGKNGGGKCVDHPYEQLYQDAFYTCDSYKGHKNTGGNDTMMHM